MMIDGDNVVSSAPVCAEPISLRSAGGRKCDSIRDSNALRFAVKTELRSTRLSPDTTTSILTLVVFHPSEQC